MTREITLQGRTCAEIIDIRSRRKACAVDEVYATEQAEYFRLAIPKALEEQVGGACTVPAVQKIT